MVADPFSPFASATYPNAAGFANVLRLAPCGNGNGGFLNACVKKTGWNMALLNGGLGGVAGIVGGVEPKGGIASI